MPDVWFVEERNPFGQWSPARYEGEKPTQKRVGGRHRVFRADPRPVLQCLSHLTISQLRECFSPDGKFQAMHREQNP